MGKTQQQERERNREEPAVREREKWVRPSSKREREIGKNQQ